MDSFLNQRLYANRCREHGCLSDIQHRNQEMVKLAFYPNEEKSTICVHSVSNMSGVCVCFNLEKSQSYSFGLELPHKQNSGAPNLKGL